jgi:membrane-associated phospholipid phosphatase
MLQKKQNWNEPIFESSELLYVPLKQLSVDATIQSFAANVTITKVNNRTNSIWHRRGIRLMMIIAGLAAWFGTQALLSARPDPENKIGDALHEWTAAANEFLHENSYWSTTLLIGTSAIIDLSGVFLLGKSLFGPTLRPFVTLLILFLTRQICQALIALPSPEGVIWYDPGFPSLFVTYYVTNDLFFSGHTGMIVVAAIELFEVNSQVGKLLSVLFVLFEITAIIVLRAHYTMDIFAGAIMALLASVVADWVVNINTIKLGKNLRTMEENKTKQL